MQCLVSKERNNFENDVVSRYLGQQFSHQPIPFPRLLVFKAVVTVLNPFECVVEF